MTETIIISTVILFFLMVVLSRPVNNFIRIFVQWRQLIKFIKEARERNLPEFKINTTSDKIIVTTVERDKKFKRKRLEIYYE